MKRAHTHDTLEGHLIEERTKISALESSLPHIHAALAQMHRLADTMVHRYQTRDLRELNLRISQVTHEIERISSGFYINKLDERASAYRVKRTAIASKRADHTTHPHHTPATIQPASEDHNIAIEAFINDATENPPPVVMDTRDDSCAICEGSMRLVAAKSLMCCSICGYSIAYLDATVSALAYGDDANLSATFSYKRINHFTEWITRIQAKTTHDVPQDTIDAIMHELAAKHIKPRDVTPSRVREAMKNIKCKTKLNEFIPHITMRITGRHPPRLTDEMEQILKLCFIALQVPFATHAPPDRKNFMSYSYVLFRICQLLGYDDILPSLTLLKGKTKLAKQDEIFALCCAELDWEFITSTNSRHPRNH